MPLHKGLLKQAAHAPNSEKHFHDYDQIWVVLSGRGTAYLIDHEGRREDFLLEAGDVLVIPAGYEHGSDGFKETGRNSDDYTQVAFNGSQPPGSHEHGHHHMDEEGYIPSLRLIKTPTDRYRRK